MPEVTRSARAARVPVGGAPFEGRVGPVDDRRAEATGRDPPS
ncbi:MAG TPA: hypothetical protein VF468_12015 [Actinomycetota bacterium]|nr:hypothetical protein [Actinomycetota bacterium]